MWLPTVYSTWLGVPLLKLQVVWVDDPWRAADQGIVWRSYGRQISNLWHRLQIHSKPQLAPTWGLARLICRELTCLVGRYAVMSGPTEHQLPEAQGWCSHAIPVPGQQMTNHRDLIE